MRKRGLGLLLILTFAVVVAALAQDFRFDLSIARERAGVANIDRTLGTIEVALANLRASQAGYLSAGQSPDFWMKRADDLAAEIDGRITALQSATLSDEARAHYEAAAAALAAWTELDRKARSSLTNDDRVLASEVVFAESVEASRRLENELMQARGLEENASIARVSALRRWRLGVTAGVFGVVLIVACVLYRRIPARASVVVPAAAEPVAPKPTAEVVPPPRPIQPRPLAPVAVPVHGGVNLPEAADVCVDLARVLDARDVPPLLARAADALEAGGVIVWVANSEGTMLYPSLSHGYPDKVLQRLGTLAVDADNATSLAFRSMRVQVINSQSFGAQGAIAVPLITSTGCVGVLAAEVKHATPGNDTLAVARMVAAQLATLVTPVTQPAEQKAVQA